MIYFHELYSLSIQLLFYLFIFYFLLFYSLLLVFFAFQVAEVNLESVSG